MTIPPGGRTSAHFHEHHETAIYVISGDEVEMYSGEELEVKEICRRYGLPYNTGPLGRQLGSVAAKICRLALPKSTKTPYDGPEVVAEPAAA